MLNEDLIDKIKKHYQYFIKCHKKASAIGNLKVTEKDFSDIKTVLNLFNDNIRWAYTKEGYIYYYVLNLRWVISVIYLCYENDKSLDCSSLEKLKKFSGFYVSLFNEEKERYFKWKKIYEQKIKKIEEIFGN